MRHRIKARACPKELTVCGWGLGRQRTQGREREAMKSDPGRLGCAWLAQGEM